MKPQSISNNETPELITFSAWLRQLGRSDTTGWRWVKAGWLHPVNIAGRPYLQRDDIQQFQNRAKRGEFAKCPAGAARKSAEARTAKEIPSP
jgi:predicted site-specific integrase-resolvase